MTLIVPDCKFYSTSKATAGLYYSQQFFWFATIYSQNERTQFCMYRQSARMLYRNTASTSVRECEKHNVDV